MSDERLSPERAADGAEALELYASAVVAMRQHQRRFALPQPPLDEIEHLAECIARGAPNPSLSVALVLAHAARDDAARAVGSAFIAVRVARRAADHDRDLVGVALAALLVDAGRARLAAASDLDLDVFSQLPDSLDVLAPAATAALAVSGPRSALRETAAVTAFETAWLERPRLGPLYAGELRPRLLTRVLLATRALLTKVSADKSPLAALHELREDAFALRLLADAVGHVPVGTVVELSTGEWGVVGPEPAQDPRRPTVWALVDARGRAAEGPLRLAPGASVTRAIEPTEARLNAAFPLVAGGVAEPK